MTIRCIYQAEPTFPATDQHPDAVRYEVAGYWVDALGGEPTADEVEALLVPSVFVVDKDVIWRRATDAEAEMMDAALKSQPARVRRIYDGVSAISSEGELFGVLKTALVQMFGEARAAELLAPV